MIYMIYIIYIIDMIYEFIYDPPQFDLFYDIYNTITEHNQRQTHYLSLILNFHWFYFDTYV